MTIDECIKQLDVDKPNQYSTEDKIRWLSFMDRNIIEEVLRDHEDYDGQYDDFRGYDYSDIHRELIAKPPHDELYLAFLKMKIDEENGETDRYNNSATIFNAHYTNYRKAYNKAHMPLQRNYYDTIGFRR